MDDDWIAGYRPIRLIGSSELLMAKAGFTPKARAEGREATGNEHARQRVTAHAPQSTKFPEEPIN